MSGMFRGGHKRPTFDTPVEFISINQTAIDKSGGYGTIQVIRGEWSGAEVIAEQTIASGDRDDFEPTGDRGVQATNIGIFAWETNGDTQRVFFQDNSRDVVRQRTRTRDQNLQWGNYSRWKPSGSFQKKDANNIDRVSLPVIHVINLDAPPANVPNHVDGVDREGILIDDATGQSLYYCNDILDRCEHYRRAIDDGLAPASRIYMADVKDIASAERVVGDLNVATTTKSLVFAHATLRPLLESGSLAKDWKVRIGGRDMDITQVMDGWVPNRYARLVVEDRS